MIINVRKEKSKRRLMEKRRVSREGLANMLYNILLKKDDFIKGSLPSFEDFKTWLLSQENFEWKYFNWEDHGFSKKYAFPHIKKIDKDKELSLNNLKLV